MKSEMEQMFHVKHFSFPLTAQKKTGGGRIPSARRISAKEMFCDCQNVTLARVPDTALWLFARASGSAPSPNIWPNASPSCLALVHRLQHVGLAHDPSASASSTWLQHVTLGCGSSVSL